MTKYVATAIENFDAEDAMAQYGIKRRSGRYPWGSGEDPYQHSDDFYLDVKKKLRDGFTYTDEDGVKYTGQMAIAKSLNLSTSELRTFHRVAYHEYRHKLSKTAMQYREEGMSLQQITEKMGFKNDSSVRSLLNEAAATRASTAQKTADFLKQQADEKGFIDVSKGVDQELSSALNLGVSEAKMDEALSLVAADGYFVGGVSVRQAMNRKNQTNIAVIGKPGSTYKDAYEAAKNGDIKSVTDYISNDNGMTFEPAFKPPKSLDSSRLMVRFGDGQDSGIAKDGLIELRRDAPDLYLGDGVHYAQVRILVDDHKYLKGMAVYSDNLPKGVDVIFNSNKPESGGKLGALKDVETIEVGPGKGPLIKNEKGKLVYVGEGKGNLAMDAENPFKALIKEHGGQPTYVDKDGKTQMTVINKRAEEGDWGEWSHDLSSQFLGKQDLQLIKRQLKLAIVDKENEYNEIMALTNPTIKRKLLIDFANNCDSASVKLKAAALPGAQFQVILPMKTLGNNECYAPNYENGTRLALVRFPHGGLFEIPIVTVNNKNPEGKSMMGNTPKDAIGIDSKTAAQLSGADFDGDTVMVIPLSEKVSIKNMKQLPGLKDFNPSDAYPGYPGMKVMSETQKGIEMGKDTNLITDMTIQGATEDELTRAVKISMVAIDAVKHKLDYKGAYEDLRISELKKRYQGRINEKGRFTTAASTILSRASSPVEIAKRVGSPKINKETGEYEYNYDNEVWIGKDGKEHHNTQKVPQMSVHKDAYELVSKFKNPKELAYAEYANKMKSLANEARKAFMRTGLLTYSKDAAEKYSSEVASMKAELNLIRKNKPKERQAQFAAQAAVTRALKMEPELANQKSELDKISRKAAAQARAKLGITKTSILIDDKRWSAIQAGAISDSTLRTMLQYTDMDSLRQRATPRLTKEATSTQKNMIRAMEASGYTNAEIAKKVGLSTTTVNKYVHTRS